MRLVAMLATFFVAAVAPAADKPNVIVILADDLGVSDLGCYGNTFHETPHLDQMAKDGIRFTNAYSACTVCSPTRAALMTGQYPARLHITDWIAGHARPFAKLSVPDWTKELKPGHYTMAKAFKENGYVTASMGKWHLGGPDCYPEKHGFDVNVAGTDKGQPPSYFSPYKIPTLPDGPVGEYVSDRLTAEACQWIETNKDKPFFLYLPHFAVHTPLQAKKDVIEKYKAKAAKLGVQKNATYAALLEGLDDSVGGIRKKLAELKLTEKTIVVFTSDNGGLIGNAKNSITTNPPYRAGKGSAYEGGVRVPAIVCRPGVLGPTIVNDEALTTDWLPTLGTLSQIKLNNPQLDGRDLSLAMTSAAVASGTVPVAKSERSLYWHYPHYHPGGATPYSAVLTADKFRLIEFFEDDHVELYDLKKDVGEKTDLAATMPEKAKALRSELAAWRKAVGAQMPTKNPKYDPKK